MPAAAYPYRMTKHLRLALLSVSLVAFVLSAAAAAQGPCKDPGSIRSVTKGRSGDFETVTFLINDGDPEVAISDTKPPFSDYSGEHKIRIPGKAWKEVVLRGIFWTCTIKHDFGAATRTITGIKQTEQFEGQANYIIGYSSKRKYAGMSNTVSGKTRKIVIKFRR